MTLLLGFTVESVTTDQLRQGDTVIDHGMVLSIDRPIETRRTVQAGQVYWSSALVTNPEDVRTDAMLWGFLHDFGWSDVSGQWERVYTGRWTIQGNRLARWARVIKA